jgi:hypothetical protein
VIRALRALAVGASSPAPLVRHSSLAARAHATTAHTHRAMPPRPRTGWSIPVRLAPREQTKGPPARRPARARVTSYHAGGPVSSKPILLEDGHIRTASTTISISAPQTAPVKGTAQSSPTAGAMGRRCTAARSPLRSLSIASACTAPSMIRAFHAGGTGSRRRTFMAGSRRRHGRIP